MPLPAETLPELLDRSGGYPPLRLLLTEHGLVGAAQLPADSEGYVRFCWDFLEAAPPREQVAAQLVREAAETLRPSPLAWLLTVPEVAQAWEQALIVDAVSEPGVTFHGMADVRLPRALLLGLQAELGGPDALVEALTQLRPWARHPATFVELRQMPVLVMGTSTDPVRLHWSGETGTRDFAPPMVAQWQGLVVQAMIHEQGRLYPQAPRGEAGPPVSVHLNYELLHGTAMMRALA